MAEKLSVEIVEARNVTAGDMLAVSFGVGPVRAVVVAETEMVPGGHWMDIVSDDGRRWQVGQAEHLMIVALGG